MIVSVPKPVEHTGPILSLTAGSRLGHYEILARIGSGGMGEVYEARDPRLKRTVAIKVLLDDLSNLPEARARFEREAQAIAGLNHPHIATLHDIGRHERTDFLVMELLEGETLAERLTRGPLPVGSALQYATEIAAGLDQAHRRAIVHRDLKPANIMLTKDGVKLLDFGLAKLRSSVELEGAAIEVTQSRATSPGTILGTVQYMAPEQLEGKEADTRSDIFAFGAVLHEMITGKPAFAGTSRASVIGAILRDTPPPISTVQPIAPPALDRVIALCLEKNPDDRWQSARDLWRELKWIAGHDAPSDVRGTAVGTGRAIGWSAASALIVGVALIAGAIAWMLKPNAVVARPPLIRLTLTLPPGDIIGNAQQPSIAISPRGDTIVYVGQHDNSIQLFVRALASAESRLLAGTSGAAVPFFSPDGEWIAFFADGKLKKMRLTGTAPQEVCDAGDGFGGAWGADDSIYFVPFNTSGVWRVPATGGQASPVTKVDRANGEVSHRWPQILPGGKALLFTVWTGPGADERHLNLQMLATGERRVLIQGASSGLYVASGHLIYTREDALMAAPFDIATMQLSGQPVALEEHVLDDEGAHFSVSDTGTFTYRRASARRFDRRLVWIDQKGVVDPLPSPIRPYTDPMISPDGRYVAFTNIGPVETIWIDDLSRHSQTSLTSTTAGSSQAPLWTPDSTRIVYRGSRFGFRNLYWIAADGGGSEERLTVSENMQTPTSVAKNSVAFNEWAPGSGSDVWVFSLDVRKSTSLLKTSMSEGTPRFSPDGQWLAYTSNESGLREVYVRPYPGPGGRLLISSGGGNEPVWSHTGRELFYRHGHQMMSVAIATTPVLTAASPRMLFEGNYLPSDTGGAGYDVAQDGRFLMVEPIEPERPATAIDVVINWFDDLRHRVPVSNR